MISIPGESSWPDKGKLTSLPVHGHGYVHLCCHPPCLLLRATTRPTNQAAVRGSRGHGVNGGDPGVVPPRHCCPRNRCCSHHLHRWRGHGRMVHHGEQCALPSYAQFPEYAADTPPYRFRLQRSRHPRHTASICNAAGHLPLRRVP